MRMIKHYTLVLAFLFIFFMPSLNAEVELKPSTENIAENSTVTLTCSYEGSSTVAGYFMSVSNISSQSPTQEGSLQPDCTIFAVQPDKSLYSYTCTNNQLSWTIKHVTRANDGQQWICKVAFTPGGSKEANLSINVQVPIQNVVMTIPTKNEITVKENTKTTFVCKTSGGLPAATVRWFKDQRTTTTTNDVEITDFVTTTSSTIDDLISVTSTLKFSPSKRDNGTKIYCIARNSADSLTSSRQPQLNVQYPPDSLPQIQNFSSDTTCYVIENVQRTLSCSVVGGNPLATLSWTCFNSGSASTSTVVGSTVTKTVTFTASRRQDRNCSCKSSHPVAAMQSVAVNVQVLYPPETPTFTVNDNSVSSSIQFIKGKTRSVVCESKGRPDPNNYTWTKGGQNIRSSGKTLTFHTVKTQDESQYKCTAENAMIASDGIQRQGTNSSILQVTVLYPPKLQRLSKMNILAGSRLNFSCPYDKGNPEETMFKWTRNGDNREWNNQILYIENVTKHDDMMYNCTVKNVMKPTGAPQETGEDTDTFHLNVLYKASITSFVVQEYVDSTSVTVEENDTVPFVCTVDSNPTSHMEIKFQNEIILTLKDTDSLNFTLDAASCLDAGVYTCNASNMYNYGKYAVRKLSLFVKCSPRPLVPVSENVTSALRESATLKFIGIAYPLPGFTWKKAGTVLSNTSNILISSSGEDTYLTIRNVSLKDYGYYELKIENEIKRFIQPFYLIPEGVPETPSDFFALENYITDTSALLQWKPGFNGGPQQTFIIRYKKVSDNSWSITSAQDSDDTVMNHTIKKLASDSEYQVVIFAQNQVGNSSSSRNLTFTTREKISKTTDPSKTVGIAVGVGSSSVFVILLVVVFVALKHRRGSTKGKTESKSDKNDRKRVYEDNENDYGMQDNPMYVSAGPRGEASGGFNEAGPVYSAVDKNRLVPESSKNDVYAEVQKPKKTKANKGKMGKPETCKIDKKAKTAVQEGDIYENAIVADTKTKQRSNDETIYENPEQSKPKKNVNKDGLIYADLAFNDEPQGQKKLVIHGLDSMTKYVEVDFKKKADPLPDSDDENVPPK